MISRARIDKKYPDGAFEIAIGETRFDRICQTYANVEEGQALALYGSLDTLEIAVRGGSAGRVLDLKRGDEIRIQARSEK